MRRNFKNINKGITLSNKLVLMFIALSMVPVFIVGFISTNVSGNVVKEKEIERRMEELILVDKEISDIIKDIDLAGIRYKLDPNVQKLFAETGLVDEFEEKVLKFEIEKKIFDYGHRLNYGLDSTYIFGNNGIVCSNKSFVDVTLEDYYEREWFVKGMNSGAGKFFGDAETINNNRVIPYVRRITDVNSNKDIGVIIVNINETIIREAYLTSFPSSTVMQMIVNSNGIVISHTNRKYIGQSLSEVSSFTEENLAQAYFEYNWQGQRVLIISNKPQNSRWTYYSIVPISEVTAGYAIIYRITLALMAAVVFFSVFIAYFLSKRITNPINELSGVMSEVETGNLDVSYPVHHQDEIGKLGISFNNMTKKLKTSMEETINVQKEKMEAELKGLEFQINPHFLYNTLSSIIWLADEGRNEEVIKVTKSLATFFRISISRGKEVIRIADEIEHVINYMEIQKLRYGDVLFVHDVDMQIKGLYTLKLLLQPIIENAIYHGVKTVTNGRGIIKLSGYRENDDVVFLVSDNGNTITQERIESLNDTLSGKTKGDFGVGLNNVNNRIKLHFGQKYGLSFSAREGYTVVEIRVPAIESEEGFDV